MGGGRGRKLKDSGGGRRGEGRDGLQPTLVLSTGEINTNDMHSLWSVP